MRSKGLIISLMLLFLVAACSPNNNKYLDENNVFSGTEITVFKSEFCGCCVGYIAELEKEGFDVKVVESQDLSSVKSQYNIPKVMQSCHTAVVEGYFIEGHVPMQAVNKLLEEKPDIDGISLAGMPPGSPGMPGAKREAFQIYALKDGVQSLFMTI